MEWCQDFESGLPEIDGQHRLLFGLIQRAHEVDERSSRAGCREVLVELEQSARGHFDSEERLMVEYGYHDTARHAADHAKLVLEVHGYQDNVVLNARQLNLVLSNWLMSHTMLEDRPLALHVRQMRTNAGGLALGTDIAGAVEPTPPSAFHSKVSEEDEKASGQ